MVTQSKGLASQLQQVKVKAKQQVAWLLMLLQLVQLLEMALLMLAKQRSSSWLLQSGAVVCRCAAAAAASRSLPGDATALKRVCRVVTCCA
jgi:hypothetical protein